MNQINPTYPLSGPHKQAVCNFLDQFKFTHEQYDHSYRFWAKGGHGWSRTFATGGTYTMKALMWYHHHHKPNSKEWRPRIIVNALCVAAAATATLDLYDWYTIRYSLNLAMNELVNEETEAEEAKRQRVDECIYTQNLQAKVGRIIAVKEQQLGVTPCPPTTPLTA